MKVLGTTIGVLVLISAARAQTTAAALERFPHHQVYEVKPGIQMTAKVDKRGAVCELQLERTHFTARGTSASDQISDADMRALFDELVPPSERGEKITKREFSSCEGDSCESEVVYTHVKVRTFDGAGTKFMTISWSNYPCDTL